MLLLALCGMVITILLWLVDKKKGGVLWFPENGPEVKLLKRKIDQRALDRVKNQQQKSKGGNDHYNSMG